MRSEPHIESINPHWPAVRDALRDAIARQELTIVVPTFNAAAFLDITLSYYTAIGLPITVFVDAKSTDDTALIAAQHTAEVKHQQNSSSVVEGMIQAISTQTGSDWILRLDDDELPSLGMLAYVAEIIGSSDTHAVGFVRQQCAVSLGQKLKASTIHHARDHRQWRLYRAQHMQWTPAVHTAGFEPVAQHSVAAPDDAFMIHLDWSLHDYQSRLKKVRRYDEHTDGKGSMWRSFYLYEDDPNHGAEHFSLVNAPEFDKVCQRIATRFPANCIAEPSRLSTLFRRLGLK